MKKIYAEFGIGNGSIWSTEFEDGDQEFRLPRLVVPETITQCYFRIWIGKRVLIISTKDGVILRKKNRNALKILFGIGGTGEAPNA